MRSTWSRLACCVVGIFVLVGITRSVPAQTRPAGAERLSSITRVYDVRDLLLQIRDYRFTGRLGAPRDTGAEGSEEGGGGGGGGKGLFGGGGMPEGEEKQPSPAENLMSL